MKNKKSIQKLAILLISGGIALFNSCQKSDMDFNKLSDEIEINPSLAAPIAFGSLTLDDLVNKFDSSGYVDRYEDSLLYIAYSDTLFTYTAADAPQIPDQQFLEEYIESDIIINPQWIGSNPGDTVRFEKIKDEEWTFDNNERLDSVHVKTLDLIIDVSSTFKHTGILHITTDNLTIDGEPFSHDIMISDVSGSFTYNTTINLDGHSLYLNNDTPGVTNLPLIFNLDLINSGNPVLLGDECRITMSFENMQVFGAFGYAGDYQLDLDDGEVSFDFFNNDNLEGEIFIEDPQFYINIHNSFGVPVGIDLGTLSVYSASKDTTSNFVLDENPYDIIAPGLDSVGILKKTIIANIYNTNSNIQDMISLLPSRLNYSVTATTNPGGVTTDNFVTDSSELQVDFEAVVPLYLYARNFVLEDTLEFNFEDEIGENADYIENLELILEVKNSLPMNVEMQLYFVDENYEILDSMFVDDKVLISPTLNIEDKVDNPNEYELKVEFEKTRIEGIKPTKNILINANVYTQASGSGRTVKFYSYYDVGFKLKMNADFSINSKDF